MTSRLRFLAVFGFAFWISSSVSADNWPGYRGPSGQGYTAAKILPTSWSPDSNIAWKTSIPGAGWSSPIIHGDRIFLTTVTDENKSGRVIRVNRRDGKIIWNKEVFQLVPRQKHGDNSYATSTPVTDGEAVYAVFADGSFAALDFDGKTLWKDRNADFYSHHGLGASPLLYRDLLIMSFDGSAKTGNKRIGWQLPWDKSYVIALDKRTGKTRWRTFRGMSRISHLTPMLLREKGQKDLILSAAGDVVQAFDPDDGRMVWTVDSPGEGIVPNPVIGEGLVFTISGFMKHTLRTVRTGGSGNITRSHIAWEDRRSVPRVPSMVYRKPYLYGVMDKGGIVTCREALTGKEVWKGRIGGNHYASPIITDEAIYFLSREGETAIIKTGATFEIIARNTIGERSAASPAVAGGQIFIRSEKSLFCIGKPNS